MHTIYGIECMRCIALARVCLEVGGGLAMHVGVARAEQRIGEYNS